MRPPGPLEVGLILVIILVITPVFLLTYFFIIRPRRRLGEQEQKESKQIKEINKNDKYLNIAKERYAKGEITQEQYEQIKKEFS